MLLLGVLACSGTGQADLIITGQVWTGDRENPRAEAVAISGDSILAVGDSATVLAKYQGPDTRRLDNGSGTVLPGFMDDHTHFIDGGFQLAGVNLRDAHTPAEFIRRIREYAATLQPGEWITGGDWDHERWTGTPLPRADWIDSVSGDHPVFVSRLDGHMGVANSIALRLSGITAATRNPPGGPIVRDRAGRPTGLLKDVAMDPIWAVVPASSPTQQDSALARAMRHAAEHGVTAVSHVSAGWSDLAAWERARDQDRLLTRAVLYLSLSRWQAVADTIARRGAGDDYVRIGGMKGYVDG
jgi:predicted amidohydrolase YtcJ